MRENDEKKGSATRVTPGDERKDSAARVTPGDERKGSAVRVTPGTDGLAAGAESGLPEWMGTIIERSGSAFVDLNIQTDTIRRVFGNAIMLHGARPNQPVSDWRRLVHPDDLLVLNRALQDCDDGTTEQVSMEMRIGSEREGWRWFLNNGMYGVLPDGVPHAWCMLSDITAQKQIQDQLLDALRETSRLEQVKTSFLANMSHELRTPLNGIVGNAKLLEMGGLDEDQGELVQAIRQSARRMVRLVQNFLLLSELEAGTVLSVMEEVHPALLLHDLIEAQAREAGHPGVTLRLLISGLLPDKLQADQENLLHILNQLVDNALKHTPSGTVTIHARMLDRTMDGIPGDQLEIEVRDSGVGIEPEQQAELFQSFKLTDDTYTRRFQGAGLGLSICRKLAHLMQATLEAESTLGVGSCFRLKIPVRLKEPAMSRDGMKPAARVLVVDDDETGRILLGMFCECEGLQPVLATNGKEALELMGRQTFDLVLLDIQMPMISGLDVCRTIRDDAAFTACRPTVVAVTAYALPGDRERFLADGFDDYMEKPISLALFGALLRKMGMVPGS